MRITVIGASAGVGLKCVERALQRGHTVTSLSRSTETLQEHPNLQKVVGSATNHQDIEKAIADSQAILVTVGTGKSTKATTLYSDTAHALVRAMQTPDKRIPVITLTGFGAGTSGKFNKFFMKIVFATLLKSVYENKTEMENIITRSDLDWIIVRPGMLTNKPLSEKYRVETRLFSDMNIGGISRNDVADFMVKQAEIPTKLFQYPALSNK